MTTQQNRAKAVEGWHVTALPRLPLSSTFPATSDLVSTPLSTRKEPSATPVVLRCVGQVLGPTTQGCGTLLQHFKISQPSEGGHGQSPVNSPFTQKLFLRGIIKTLPCNAPIRGA